MGYWFIKKYIIIHIEIQNLEDINIFVLSGGFKTN